MDEGLEAVSFDDQYDAPLNGPERVRQWALHYARANLGPSAAALDPDKWVEAARPLEQYIIGHRGTEAREQIEAAYKLASRLLSNSPTVNDWSIDDPDRVEVETKGMRELVNILSRLADGAPF